MTITPAATPVRNPFLTSIDCSVFERRRFVPWLTFTSRALRNIGRSCVDARYAKSLAAPDSISTLREVTLGALEERGETDLTLPCERGDKEGVLPKYTCIGLTVDNVVARACLLPRVRRGTPGALRLRRR